MVGGIEAQAQERYVCGFNVACLYAALGDKERAFTWLEKAYHDRSDSLPSVEVDLRLDSLRADPRIVNPRQCSARTTAGTRRSCCWEFEGSLARRWLRADDGQA